MAADISNSIDQAMTNLDQPDDQIQNLGLSEPQIHRFGGILRTLNLEAIPAFASNIRQSGHHTTGIYKCPGNTDLIPCKIIGSPLCGSFHIVFTLEFEDGVKWMLKISANGHHFDSVAAAALVSEARTMQLLKNETTIPVPAVYAFDATSSNELNSPFILMERIDGKPLWQGWFDDEIPKARLEHFRIKALQSLAEAMAQLNKFTLNRGGALEFDATGKPVGLRGAKVVDAVAMYYQGMGSEDVSKSNHDIATNHHDVYDESHGKDHVNGALQDTGNISKVDNNAESTDKADKNENEDEDDEDITCEKGPFDCPKSAFLFDVDRSDVYRKDDEYTQGCYKALRIFIDLAFANFEDPGRRFVLTHPDLDLQNVLMADDGTLRGLIDWDGVASVPREVGCAQYPLWLMRDWVPYYYVYDEQERKTEEDADYEESSPAELASYRAMYARFMEKEIERQTGGPDRVTTFGTLPKQEAQLTRRSLVMRDLNLAGSSPFLTSNVMCHILNQIEQVTEADWEDVNIDLVGENFGSACASEGAVDVDAEINSNINNESDEQNQQDTEIVVIETNDDILCRAAAGADEMMLEPVASRATADVTAMSPATQERCHEPQNLSKACKMEAETTEMAQSSNTELKAQPSSNSASLGWGRRLLCFGCSMAEKALKRVTKIGHILEDGIEEIADVLAEVEVNHQDCTENPSEGELRESIHHHLSLQHWSGNGTLEVAGTRPPDLRQSTQGKVEPEHLQNIPSIQATVEYHDDYKEGLRSNSSATDSKNGDNDGSDAGKSCKSSVTSLSDKEIEFDKKVKPNQNKDDVFETEVTRTARHHSSENSTNDVCDEIEMSEAMEKMAPPKLPTFARALDTEKASNKPWFAGRMYDPCRGEWVKLRETRQPAKTGLKTRGAETESAEDNEDGLVLQIEEGFKVGEKVGLGTESENDSEKEVQDETGNASFASGSGNAEECVFEDDGEFRSRNIFMLLGLDRLDDVRLLRMKEGFLKLLVEF